MGVRLAHFLRSAPRVANQTPNTHNDNDNDNDDDDDTPTTTYYYLLERKTMGRRLPYTKQEGGCLFVVAVI